MADLPTTIRQLEESRSREKMLARKLHDRDETIRSLQSAIQIQAAVSGVVPPSYAIELVALASLAYFGRHNGDISNVQTGKPESTGTRLENRALVALEKELRYLQRRAARDPVSGAARGALAHAVDHLEEGAAA